MVLTGDVVSTGGKACEDQPVLFLSCAGPDFPKWTLTHGFYKQAQAFQPAH